MYYSKGHSVTLDEVGSWKGPKWDWIDESNPNASSELTTFDISGTYDWFALYRFCVEGSWFICRVPVPDMFKCKGLFSSPKSILNCESWTGCDTPGKHIGCKLMPFLIDNIWNAINQTQTLSLNPHCVSHSSTDFSNLLGQTTSVNFNVPVLGAEAAWGTQWLHQALKPCLSAINKTNQSISIKISYDRTPSILCTFTLLEFGIRFCNAFIFSLILLLLLCSTNHNTWKPKKKKTNNILSHEEKGKLETHNHTRTKKPTFSDKLWTSAALLRFEEFRAPDDFAAASSINASRPSCV